MAFRSSARGQEWRNSTQPEIPLWTTSFDPTRSQIPKTELQQTLLHSDSTKPEYPSPGFGSSYELPSSPLDSPTAAGRRVPTRSQAGCAPSGVPHRSHLPGSSDSDSNQATSRKRGFSQVTSSLSNQRAAQRDTGNNQDNQSRYRAAQFCTQRYLLGLQSGGVLDDYCPNVRLHSRSENDLKHPITSEDLVRLLKAQLDENIDRYTPLEVAGRTVRRSS